MRFPFLAALVVSCLFSSLVGGCTLGGIASEEAADWFLYEFNAQNWDNVADRMHPSSAAEVTPEMMEETYRQIREVCDGRPDGFRMVGARMMSGTDGRRAIYRFRPNRQDWGTCSVTITLGISPLDGEWLVDAVAFSSDPPREVATAE